MILGKFDTFYQIYFLTTDNNPDPLFYIEKKKQHISSPAVRSSKPVIQPYANGYQTYQTHLTFNLT